MRVNSSANSTTSAPIQCVFISPACATIKPPPQASGAIPILEAAILRPEATSTLHARPLGKSLLCMVASPEHLAKRGLPKKVSDLSSHDLIGFTGSKVLNRWPLAGIDCIEPSLTTSNGETVKRCVNWHLLEMVLPAYPALWSMKILRWGDGTRY